MKKLLQVFILICLPLSVFATGHNINGVTNCVNVDGVANPAAVNGVAAEAGGDSWSCTDAALICESFDATGFDNGGSSSATKTGTIIDEDYANTTGVGCDSSNVQSFRFYQTDAGGTGHGVSWDNGSQSVIYVNFWFNVVAITEINRMVHLGDSNPYSDDAFYMLFNPVDSTNYTITATAHSGSLGTTGNLTKGTWYQCKITYDKNTPTCTVEINDSTVGTVTNNSWTTRYFSFGHSAVYGSLDIRFDALKASVSGMPTCDP